MDLIANHGNNLKWWKGRGDGTFEGTGYCTNRGTNNSGGGFTFGDIYGTGSLDMVIQSKDGDNVYMGTVRGVDNNIPSAPEEVSAQRSCDMKSITVTWKAGSDKETPAKALAYNVIVKYGTVERALVPVNVANGKLKVVQDMQTLITGEGETFCATFYVPEDVASTDITVGVQTVDGVYAGSELTCSDVTPTFSESYDGSWNGKVNVPETAANLDELLTYTVEFEEAASVTKSGHGVLAAIFDGSGDPYAIVFSSVAGEVEYEHDKVTLKFKKFSDINEEYRASVAGSVKKALGGSVGSEGTATVVIASKCFCIDGTYLYTDMITNSYALAGGTLTSISNALGNIFSTTIYNLNGQAIRQNQHGVVISGGKKTLK